MVTFFDELAKVIEPHGVAADRLNKELVAMMVSLYNRGLTDGMALAAAGYGGEAEWQEKGLRTLEEAKKMVEKEKRAIGV